MKLETDYIPIAEIPNELGIESGEILWVASDVFKLGYQAWTNNERFDADGFIDILQKSIGETGTLLFPAFTWPILTGEPFDLKSSMPVSGTLSKTAVKREDFMRTQHPIHSFSVWGRHQETLCSLCNYSSFSKKSPFAFLHEMNAKMLMIDVDYQQCFTFVHYVEELEDVWYRKKRSYRISYVDTNGHAEQKEYFMNTRRLFIYTDVNRMGQILENRGVSIRKYINGISFVMIDLSEAFELILNEIRYNRARRLYCLLPKKVLTKIRQIVTTR